MAALMDGLQYGALTTRFGMTHAVGWASDEVRYAASSRTDYAREVLTGVAEYLVVCAAVVTTGDPPPTTVEVQDDGAILVGVHDTPSFKLYRCRNYADGFAEVTV